MILSAEAWITQLLENFLGSFTNVGTAVFNFLKEGFVTLFLKTSEGAVTGPSEFGIFVFFCLGLTLCLGLTKFITSMCRRKI